MNQSLEAMLKYQDVDLKLFDIESELEKNDAYQAGARARQNFMNAKKRMDVCEKRAEDIINNVARNQREYDSVKQKIGELKLDVQESDADDDVDYIVGVLKKLQDTATAVEREVEDLQRQITELTRLYNEAREVLKKSKSAFDAHKEEYDKFYATRKNEMDELRGQLEKMQTVITPALFAKYSALRRDKHVPVLRELVKEKDGSYRCPRCRMELDAATAEKVRIDGLGECATCRHILYKK